MAEYKMVRLGDVCEIQSGGTPSRSKTEYWKDGTIPWVKIGDFSGKYLDKTTEHITQQGLDNSSAKLFSKGTILYSIFATLGEATILNIDATTNQAIAGIKIKDKSSVDIDYFYSFLKSLKDEVNRIGRGVAQNNINLSILKSFFIPLPPLETQKQIAAQLDKCTAVIAKHKQLLEKYDTLIKSRFIEMFGDPVQNPMGWENKFGKELFSFSSGKFLDASKRMEKGIPVYGGNGIAWYTDIPLISFDTIIIGRVGAYCGNIKKVQEPVWVTDNAIYIKQFKEKCFNLYFLYELMSYMNFYQYTDFSGQPKITQKPLENNKYIIPPIKKQKQFAAFVQQIDKSKFEYNIEEIAA